MGALGEATGVVGYGILGAGKGLGTALSGAFYGGATLAKRAMVGAVAAPFDYLAWRGNASNAWKEELAMAEEARNNFFKHGTENLSDAHKASLDKHFKHGTEKGKRFARTKINSRGVGKHFSKGMSNLRKAALSPGGWAINMSMAMVSSSDNIFDPREGFATQLAAGLASEVGFIGGSAMGAAIGSILLPGFGSIIGAVAGGLLGGSGGYSAVTGGLGAVADFGYKYGAGGRRHRRGSFVDSEYAMTMRQRAYESIQRSQMGARNAFGSESMAYHQ